MSRYHCTVILALFLMCGVCLAEPQRLLVPAGAQATVPPDGSASLTARCIDPHLSVPATEDVFGYVAPRADIVVAIGDDAPIPLSEAIATNRVRFVGRGIGLTIENLTASPIRVIARSNSLLASAEGQVSSLGELQTQYANLGITSQTHVWRHRYEGLAGRMGYSSDADPAERPRTDWDRLQAEWGLPETGELDLDTRRFLSDRLSIGGDLGASGPDQGRVLTILNVRRHDEPLFRVFDEGAGAFVPFGGAPFETDALDAVRAELLREHESGRPVAYVRLVGFSKQNAENFRTSLRLADVRAIGPSRAFIRPGARLVRTSEVSRQPDGSFLVRLEFVVMADRLALNIRARTRDTAARAAGIARDWVDPDARPRSVRSTVHEVRRILKDADLTIDLVDEYGASTLVHTLEEGEAHEPVRLADRHLPPAHGG